MFIWSFIFYYINDIFCVRFEISTKNILIPVLMFNSIIYLFDEDYIQPEATSSSPQVLML
jgi:hypothetical protein